MAVTGKSIKKLSSKARDIIDEYFEGVWSGLDGGPPLTLHKMEGGRMDKTYFLFEKPDNLTRVVLRGSAIQEYNSKIKDTKTKKADERAKTVVITKYQQLIRSGWYETEEEAEESGGVVTLPMRYKKLRDHSDKLSYPVVCQPKYDGVRAMWNPIEQALVSRGGKVYDLPFISKQIKASGLKNVWLDGEICYESPKRLLQEVVEGVSAKDEDLRFFIWDLITHTKDIRVYRDRIAHILKYTKDILAVPYLRVSEMVICNDPHEVDEYYEEMVLRRNFEGTMVKDMSEPYGWDKRVSKHLKNKIEFEEHMLVDYLLFDKHPEYEQIASFQVLAKRPSSEDHKAFKCIPAWSHAERHELFKMRTLVYAALGKLTVLVEHRGYSGDGVPIHAVVKTPFKEFVDAIKKTIEESISKIE